MNPALIMIKAENSQKNRKFAAELARRMGGGGSNDCSKNLTMVQRIRCQDSYLEI